MERQNEVGWSTPDRLKSRAGNIGSDMQRVRGVWFLNSNEPEFPHTITISVTIH